MKLDLIAMSSGFQGFWNCLVGIYRGGHAMHLISPMKPEAEQEINAVCAPFGQPPGCTFDGEAVQP